jgi:hypothetical protein
MTVAALGTLLLGLLPRESVLAMVSVVGACLALALIRGLFTLRAPAESPGPLRLRGETAKSS